MSMVIRSDRKTIQESFNYVSRLNVSYFNFIFGRVLPETSFQQKRTESETKIDFRFLGDFVNLVFEFEIF